MLHYAVVFFVIALIAAVFGFGGIAGPVLAQVIPLVGRNLALQRRIHRDVRFSKDKSPYKTHAACWFYHAGGSSKVGREAHGGGAG